MNLAILEQLKHSPLSNYAGVPGLTSWLLGSSENAIIRLFECSRDHEENITPHSHRFAFECMVLDGHVDNTIFTVEPVVPSQEKQHGDLFQVSEVDYDGVPGEYEYTRRHRDFYTKHTTRYRQGDTYFMEPWEVHSIKFSRGARVLFIEAKMPDIKTNIILEPVVDGVTIPTFRVESWMFKKG